MSSLDLFFWKETVNSEIDSNLRNDTWELVHLPSKNKPLGSKWIFKRKMKVDGTIDKYRTRLVVNGFKQKTGLDYFNTYSPVTRITLIQMLIALAAVYDLQIHQMDVKTTFLNRGLEEEIYMKQPEGFVVSGKENKVFSYGRFKVTHSMRFSNSLMSVGFSPDCSTRVIGASNGMLYIGRRKVKESESMELRNFGGFGLMVEEIRLQLILQQIQGIISPVSPGDIKARNILLDDKFQPRIGDFGLAKVFPEDQAYLNTAFAGTLYLKVSDAEPSPKGRARVMDRLEGVYGPLDQPHLGGVLGDSPLILVLKGPPLVILSFPPVQSVDPPVIPVFILGTLQTPNSILVLAPTSEHSVSRLGVQSSSMLPPQIGSQPARFTMPHFTESIIMSSEDQKRFERFTYLGPPRFSGVMDEDAYEFLVDCQ
ncbi:hypothetical protein T459_16103 [Capsicum annuum]|uniref:Reverse transcriptase Ty1/copia-type domain-containing protein n=1 Tax=Capsicum annuum TaxID=4072 RepID=A0A2G2Z822_CAPAN|nr:hypothetical protein T459_16103 [Capsicum annuum]